MTRDQKIVAIGAASGVAAMIASVFVLYQLWPVNPGLANVSSRIAYMAVGNDRFLSEAIDPTLQKESRAMQLRKIPCKP